MKKAQHGPILLFQEGQLIGWGADDVKNLIKSANEAVINEETKTKKLSWKELSDIIVYEWFEQFVEKGITKEIVNDLNKRISHIEYRRALMHSKKGPPYWREVADATSLKHPDLKTAYVISHLLAIGALENLKRCHLEDCRKFFIGLPNRKWCSKSCGSLYRVREKRKREKY
ncbi:MAG: CGNR zinc finger domain-containing protein [Bdellovibrionales bacterium]|nr:CGNR zinc finger domain-containing protein [Bdellovibrionales bacterium]